MIKAIPIIPMLPAKEVKNVRAFFVIKLFKLNEQAILKDMPGLFNTLVSTFISCSLKGLESDTKEPSFKRIIRLEYSSANCGLWVTIMTSLSFEISFKISIICTLVALSKAPVGSSAKIISGLLTIARAMATRCICPPDIWVGFL